MKGIVNGLLYELLVIPPALLGGAWLLGAPKELLLGWAAVYLVFVVVYCLRQLLLRSTQQTMDENLKDASLGSFLRTRPRISPSLQQPTSSGSSARLAGPTARKHSE